MTDPYSIAKGAFIAFKDVYLVSKFVYKTVKGMKSKDADWNTLESKFQHEFLMVAYFGRTFLQDNNYMDESIAGEVSKLWVRDVGAILERQQELFANYSKIALQQDPNYKKYGFLNASNSEPLQIGFAWELEEDETTTDEIAEGTSNQLGASKKSVKDSLKDRIDEIKFVWFRKDKIEQLLEKFRLETQRLRDWVPLVVANHPRFKTRPFDQEQMIRDIVGQTAMRFGVGYHDQIRQITMGHDRISQITTMTGSREVQDLVIPDSAHLEPADALGITDGSLSKPGGANLAHILVEYKPYRLSDVEHGIDQQPSDFSISIEGKDEIQSLACLLASAGNPSFHTLRLRNYIDQKEKKRYAFIFDYPPNSPRGQPTSLYEIINSSSSYNSPNGVLAAGSPRAAMDTSANDISTLSISSQPVIRGTLAGSSDTVDVKFCLRLESRFKVAQILSKTIAAFHADGWVHKNIRSESVVFFKGLSPDLMYNHPYLVGFEYARPIPGDTTMATDMSVERNIYRHPDRQGAPRKDFCKTHDLYALGVVLLEIGLSKTAMAIYKDLCGARPTNATMRQAQDTFKFAAEHQLPGSMGTAYAKAVTVCLSDQLAKMEEMTNFGLIFVDRVVKELDYEKLRVEGASEE